VKRVLKIIAFVLGVKKCNFLSKGGSQEKVSEAEGSNIFGKMTEGVKLSK